MSGRTLDLTLDLSRLSPREVVHVPVRVGREDKVPDRERKQVDELHRKANCQPILSSLGRGGGRGEEKKTHHPPDVGELSARDNNEQTGKTEDERQQDEGQRRRRLARNDGNYDDVNCKSDGSRQNECSDQLDKDDELTTGKGGQGSVMRGERCRNGLGRT